MKKYLLPIVAIVLAIGCYVLGSRSAHERLEILELKASAEAGNQREIKERTEIEHLRFQIGEYRKASLLSPPRAGESVVSQGQGASSLENFDLTPFMMKDPAYARIHRQRILNMVMRQYGDLKALNLPADQLQKLTDLLADRYTTQNDAEEASIQAGIKYGTPEFTKAEGDATKDDDDQIKTLLGSSGYQQLQDSANLNNARMRLQFPLAVPLVLTGTPLTNDQLSALTNIQVQLQNLPPETRTQEFNAQAAQVLTPDQYSVYMQSSGSQKDYNDLIQRAQAAAKQEYGDIKSWRIGGP